MKCPRCDGSVLEEKDREGITVDICRECRGVWLDRGELEKIIARSSRDDDRDDDDDDDDDSRLWGDSEASRPPPRRRSWFESLGDIFD